MLYNTYLFFNGYVKIKNIFLNSPKISIYLVFQQYELLKIRQKLTNQFGEIAHQRDVKNQ